MTPFLNLCTKVLVIASAFFFFTSFVETHEKAACSIDSTQKEHANPKDSIITLGTGLEFIKVISEISRDSNSLFVFDIDNTLLITNDNKFGSDWWYAQTKTNPDLKLNVDAPCLFGILTPLFYSTFSTKPVFPDQAGIMDLLEEESNKTIALTSRGYTPVVASATELELTENEFDFLDGDSLGLSKDVVMLHGVIYTRGQNKGVALLKYLDTHSYTNIYYFDDSKYKVENVQEAFADAHKPISLYHMTIAPKIQYTEVEVEYMKEKLCILIESINTIKETDCKCKNP